MNEIIAGIRIVKIHCWEKSFGKLIEKIRRLVILNHNLLYPHVFFYPSKWESAKGKHTHDDNADRETN